MILYFNPRAPRGARPNRVFNPCNSSNISIHAPREGRDIFMVGDVFSSMIFQSTRPARGATLTIPSKDNMLRISIHAPREGRDDSVYAQYIWAIGISIHAPREGRDKTPYLVPLGTFYFNPRAPRGARQQK